LKRNDYIALIIEHIVNQGYKSADNFVEFITMVLPMMNEKELHDQLESLESNT